MDMFSFIKDCLLTYNYPLAHSMNEDELADIFKTCNRCFLISWMLKLLDNTYEEVLENFENDKEFLGNIVYELGFCTQKETSAFMSGGLPVTEQIKIIFNIFTFITDIKKYKDQENAVSLSNDDITALVHTDLNLFPMYGEINLQKQSEKTLKLSELEKEIDDIKADQEAAKTEARIMLDNSFKEDMLEFIEKLKVEFPKMKSAMLTVSKNRRLETSDIIEIKPDLVITLKECCKNMKIISQFIKDINTIEDFEKHVFELKERSRNDSAYEMIKALHRELLTVLKYSKCL